MTALRLPLILAGAPAEAPEQALEVQRNHTLDRHRFALKPPLEEATYQYLREAIHASQSYKRRPQ